MKIKPLDQLRILDMTRYILGGLATQVFADMGVEVIKVEDTNIGDLCRVQEPEINGISHYFTALCRNKKSVSINIKTEQGRTIFKRLAAKSDIIIENFRPGVTRRLGIDYEAIKDINPEIIYCSLTGFGQFDERSQKALHDINLLALSGYMHLNGGKLPPLPYCDIAGAMVAVQDLFAALYQRAVTGEGCYIDVSMFDSFIWWKTVIYSRFDFRGGDLGPDTIEHPEINFDVYETKDGRKLALGMLEKKFWDTFCEEIGRPDFSQYYLKRRSEIPEQYAEMDALIASKTLEEWLERLSEKDFCITHITNVAEAVAYIVGMNTGAMKYCDFPITGRVLQTNIPHKISSIPVSLDKATPPPALGEHNQAVLSELGYTSKEIEEFRANGVIGK